MYGPITTLRRNNQLVKHIPWSAFKMSDRDWTRVVDARDILGVSTFQFLCRLQHLMLSHPLGFQSNSTVLFLRKTTNPLACTSSSRRVTNRMGGQARFTKICPLRGRPQRW